MICGTVKLAYSGPAAPDQSGVFPKSPEVCLTSLALNKTTG